MKALVNYSGENANFDDYAIFKRKNILFRIRKLNYLRHLQMNG